MTSEIHKQIQERWNRGNNLKKESNRKIRTSQLQNFPTTLQQCRHCITDIKTNIWLELREQK